MDKQLKQADIKIPAGPFWIDLREAARAAEAGASRAGGKAANLARLAGLGLPTPSAVVLTTDAWRYFLQRARIRRALRGALGSRGDGNEEKAGAAARRLILDAPLPGKLRTQIAAVYSDLSENGARSLAIRSSAVDEDSPDASFSGMLSTVLGVASLEAAIAAVKKCWSSGFNARSLVYLNRLGLDPLRMEVAIIFQRMVEARSSGVLFTVDPATGAAGVAVLEAAFGYGPGVVSGEITPDLYRIDKKTRKIVHRDSRPQEFYYTADGSRRQVEAGRRAEGKLSDKEVRTLVSYGLKAEKSLGAPQDIEWCKSRAGLVLLQTRPVTGIRQLSLKARKHVRPEVVIVRGIGVSPRVGWGEVVILEPDGSVKADVKNKVVVIERLTQDLAPQLKDAAAVLADEGGATSHGANILREMHLPTVIGTRYGRSVLHDGDVVTVDGWRGLVLDGIGPRVRKREYGPEEPIKIRTRLMTTINIPESAEKAAAISDGVISFRNDYLLLQGGVHPGRLLKSGRKEVLTGAVEQALVMVARAFAGKRVWYKTLDAPTDEFRRLRGGEDEPLERNPLLGWRGIRRELDNPALLGAEYEAVRRAVAAGCTNLGVKVPFVRNVHEYEWAREVAIKAGLKPHENVAFGASIETPATALTVESLLNAKVDFISVGVNDLTMCCLGVDRESERMADYFDPAHPAVLALLKEVAGKAAGKTFVAAAGDIAQAPRLMEALIDLKFDAIGISLPYLGTVRAQVAELEKPGVHNG